MRTSIKKLTAKIKKPERLLIPCDFFDRHIIVLAKKGYIVQKAAKKRIRKLL